MALLIRFLEQGSIRLSADFNPPLSATRYRGCWGRGNRTPRRLETALNQTEVAIALEYDTAGDDLPRITATGRGAIARQMLAVAEEHGIPVQRDRALAELLQPLEVGSPIPLAAFVAVAEILAHLYRADRRLAQGHGG